MDENPNPSALLWELLSTTRSQHSPFLVGISLINPLPLLRTTVDIFAGNGSCPRKRSHETHDGPPAENNDDTSACFHTSDASHAAHTQSHRHCKRAHPSGHTPYHGDGKQKLANRVRRLGGRNSVNRVQNQSGITGKDQNDILIECSLDLGARAHWVY